MSTRTASGRARTRRATDAATNARLRRDGKHTLWRRQCCKPRVMRVAAAVPPGAAVSGHPSFGSTGPRLKACALGRRLSERNRQPSLETTVAFRFRGLAAHRSGEAIPGRCFEHRRNGAGRKTSRKASVDAATGARFCQGPRHFFGVGIDPWRTRLGCGSSVPAELHCVSRWQLRSSMRAYRWFR